MTNRYLGDAFVLQLETAEAPATMGPPPTSNLATALWQFEEVGSYHRMRNVAFPDEWFSGLLRRVDPGETVFLDWIIEPVDDEFQADESLYLLHPADVPARTLDIGPTPPYTVGIAPGRGDAGQHWRLAPHVLCE